MRRNKRFVLKRKAFFIRGATLVIPVVCALLLLSQTVFAQNTYVITDGSRVLVHTTFATDPAKVLGEAGLELDADDTFTTQQGDGVSEITIQRGIEAAPPGSGTVTVEETYTQNIAHGVTTCNDASLPAGTTKVLTKGQDGQLVCTASVTYVDGEEMSRSVLTQTVIQQPIDEVVAIGTGGEDLEAGYIPTDMPIIGDGYIITSQGEVLTYTDVISTYATAYCDNGITACGTQSRVGAIAVDPSVIPYGTRMFIISDDGQYVYGIATAEDTGDPDYIGGNRIDLFFNTYSECIEFGARNCTVYILGETEVDREYW